jgi:HSP20 family protein
MHLMPFRRSRLQEGSPYRSEIERFFDDFFGGSMLPVEGSQGAQGFQLDLYEDENRLCVTAELPGIDEKDVDVQLNRDILTIRAEKKQEQEVNKRNWHRTERSYGMFTRSIRLPVDIRTEQVSATFKNGVLEVILPKSMESQSMRRIPVGGGTVGSGRTIEPMTTEKEQGTRAGHNGGHRTRS